MPKFSYKTRNTNAYLCLVPVRYACAGEARVARVTFAAEAVP